LGLGFVQSNFVASFAQLSKSSASKGSYYSSPFKNKDSSLLRIAAVLEGYRPS